MEKTVREHLKDLKKHLLIVVIPFVLLFFLFFYLSPVITNIVLNLVNTPETVSLTPLESVSTQIRIALSLAFLITIPLFIFSIYSFIKDELDKKVRKKIIKYITFAYLLAIVGVIFSLTVFSRILFTFFQQHNLVQPMWSIMSVIQSLIFFSITFALIMQITILLPLFNKAGLLNVKLLKSTRLPLLLVIFIISAILTPPDFISQILMAVPIYGSFELGMLFCKFKRRIK